MTESETRPSTEHAKIDFLTISAVAIIVYFLCCFLHEAAGHGGAAALLGARVTRITTAYCRYEGAGEVQSRLIAAAGISVSLVFGCLTIFGRGRLRRSGNDVAHYFFWLFTHMNLFTAGGYMMTFSLMKVGDMNIAVRGLPFEMEIRVAILLAGLAITVWTFFHAGRTLEEFAGQGDDRMRRAVSMTLVPYLVGGCVNVGASLLGVGNVPLAIVLVSSVGATFGGNFPFVWAPKMMQVMRSSNEPVHVLTPTRTRLWLIAGVVFLVLYIFLGLGISFA